MAATNAPIAMEEFLTVVEVNVKVEELEEPGQNNIHNNAFYAEEKLLRTEQQVMRDYDPFTAGHWIVRNTRTVNRTWQLTGYKLVPGLNCLPFAGPEAMFLRRATFLKHNLWVTPYKRDEMYPGGEFPNQNPRLNERLATWVKKNRSLEETNVCVWSYSYSSAGRLASYACGASRFHAHAQVPGTTQDHLQIFNIELKIKIKSHQVPEQVVFWKWIIPTMIGLVTQTSIYHWSIEGDSEPAKLFDRTANLTKNQIINYHCDPSEKWLVLIGTAPGAPEHTCCYLICHMNTTK